MEWDLRWEQNLPGRGVLPETGESALAAMFSFLTLSDPMPPHPPVTGPDPARPTTTHRDLLLLDLVRPHVINPDELQPLEHHLVLEYTVIEVISDLGKSGREGGGGR